MTGSREQAPPGPQPRGRGRPGPAPALVARAAELRAAGKPDRAIGKELGVDHKQVARWLGASGRGPGRPRAGAAPEEVARLRDQPVTRLGAMTWREIGEALGVSHETARQRYASKEAAVSDLERRPPEDDPGGGLAE